MADNDDTLDITIASEPPPPPEAAPPPPPAPEESTKLNYAICGRLEKRLKLTPGQLEVWVYGFGQEGATAMLASNPPLDEGQTGTALTFLSQLNGSPVTLKV